MYINKYSYIYYLRTYFGFNVFKAVFVIDRETKNEAIRPGVA